MKSANSQRKKSAKELLDNQGVSNKEKRFISEYQKDSNATQAAIRAGYSPENAGQIAHQLMKKTSVAKAIANKKT